MLPVPCLSSSSSSSSPPLTARWQDEQHRHLQEQAHRERHLHGQPRHHGARIRQQHEGEAAGGGHAQQQLPGLAPPPETEERQRESQGIDGERGRRRGEERCQ